MRRPRWLAVLLVPGAVMATVACSDNGSGAAGGPGRGDPTAAGGTEDPRPYAVSTVTETFVDETRPTEDPDGGRSAPTRTIETSVYVPEGTGPFPLVVLAHGFNGHPRKFSQLATAWAEGGYVVAVPAFPLTNDRSGGEPVLADVANQPADVSFVIDEILRSAAGDDATLAGRVDGDRIGVAGHSLGGATAYGVTFNDCCRDERIDAVVLMDTLPLPYGEHSYRFAGVPALLLHLTEDSIVPYDQATATYARLARPKFLVTLEGAGHFEPYEDTPSPHDRVVTATTTAFWDAYLLNDAAGVDRLAGAAEGTGGADAARIRADP